MPGSTGCGAGNLHGVVFGFLREVERCLAECAGELGAEDIARELGYLTPSLSVVLSKWVPEIIYCLYIEGRMGFNELKNVLGVSSRVLSDKLKLLADHGLVSRRVEPEKPPRVYYELTGSGRLVGLALVPLLTVLKHLYKQRCSKKRAC